MEHSAAAVGPGPDNGVADAFWRLGSPAAWTCWTRGAAAPALAACPARILRHAAACHLTRARRPGADLGRHMHGICGCNEPYPVHLPPQPGMLPTSCSECGAQGGLLLFDTQTGRARCAAGCAAPHGMLASFPSAPSLHLLATEAEAALGKRRREEPVGV